LDKAERFLRQSLEYDENLAASLLALSRIQYKNGEYLSARAFLQRYEVTADHTEESLLAAFQIERELGDEQAATEYRRQLIQQFPHSEAAQSLLRPQNYNNDNE